MADTETKRFTLAGLARAATHISFDWRSWAPSSRKFERRDELSAEMLDKLIESEIIPRLMLANRPDEGAASAHSQVARPQRYDAEEIDQFARTAIQVDADSLAADVDARMKAGATHDDILLRLLAPAARRLGVLWEEDDVDFTDVTIALLKLQRIVQRINDAAPLDRGAGDTAPRILLAPALGEQHLLGVLMVGEFFARSGWSVRCEPHKFSEHIVACVAEEHYDVVGLSASTHDAAKALAAEISAIRSASLNLDVVIMVGGPIFNDDVHLAKRIGADATAVDGLRAVVTAEQFVRSRAGSVGAAQ